MCRTHNLESHNWQEARRRTVLYRTRLVVQSEYSEILVVDQDSHFNKIVCFFVVQESRVVCPTKSHRSPDRLSRASMSSSSGSRLSAYADSDLDSLSVSALASPVLASPPAALARQMQGLKVDEIVHPDDRAKAHADFKCPICLGIPSTSSAVQTVCCNTIFCADCLAPLGACPNCRAGFHPYRKTAALPPLVRRMLLSLKVVCPNHASVRHSGAKPTSPAPSSTRAEDDNQSPGGGGGSGARVRPRDIVCDWSGSYGDLLNKHLAECSYAEIDCPHGCGERFLRDQLSTHEESCEKGFEKCGICRAMVKIGGMAGHRAESAEAHVKILEADRADLRAQVTERDAVQTKVDGVKAVVDTIAVNTRAVQANVDGVKAVVDTIAVNMSAVQAKVEVNTLAVTSNTIAVNTSAVQGQAELKTMYENSGEWLSKLIALNGLGPRVIWTVKTSEMFEKCPARGSLFNSPEFYLGMSKFAIHLWPLGEKENIMSEDGKAALFVVQTGGELYFPNGAEVVLSAVGNEFEPVSRWFDWKLIFDAPFDADAAGGASPGGSGYRDFIDIADLRKASEITVSLRHSDGDNGRVIELGASAKTHSHFPDAAGKSDVVLDRALELFRTEMKKTVLEGLVSLGVTAVAAAAVICLAIVVGRK